MKGSDEYWQPRPRHSDSHQRLSPFYQPSDHVHSSSSSSRTGTSSSQRQRYNPYPPLPPPLPWRQTYYSRPTSHRDQASSSSGAGSSGRLPRSQLVQNVHPLSNPGQSLEYYSISQRRQSNPNDPQTATSRQVYSSNSQPEPSSGNQQHYEEEEAVVARQAAAEPTSGLVQQDEALDEVRSSASTVSLI